MGILGETGQVKTEPLAMILHVDTADAQDHIAWGIVELEGAARGMGRGLPRLPSAFPLEGLCGCAAPRRRKAGAADAVASHLAIAC